MLIDDQVKILLVGPNGLPAADDSSELNEMPISLDIRDELSDELVVSLAVNLKRSNRALGFHLDVQGEVASAISGKWIGDNAFAWRSGRAPPSYDEKKAWDIDLRVSQQPQWPQPHLLKHSKVRTPQQARQLPGYR